MYEPSTKFDGLLLSKIVLNNEN